MAFARPSVYENTTSRPAPGTASGAVATTPPARQVERRLLLWNLLPLLCGALAVGITAPGGFAPAFRGAVTTLVPLYAACLAVHLVFCLLRFTGDATFLPLVSLLFVIGGIYHLGISRPGGGVTAEGYVIGVLVGLGVILAIVAGDRLLRRLALLFEEKVWWRVAGDLPYYGSTPFHVLLLGGMGVLLIWLRVFGRAEGGASDAIVQVPLPGGWSFTPSEFVRLAVAFFLAEYLAANSKILRNLRQPLGQRFPLNRIVVEHKPELVVVLTMLLLYGAFFYLFRDFGPAVIIFALTLLCLLAATRRAPTPLALAAIAFLVVALPAHYGWGFRTLHHRVAMWLSPWETSFPNGDHLARALWGVASGGWFGIGVGTVNLRVPLPEAARDTVFAGLATTMGFWVAAAVLALHAALTWRGYQVARAAATDHGRMLAFSLTSLLALQTIWICAASVRILPLSGINLPFMSTGISSMIASCIPLAVLLNLSRPVREGRREGGDPSFADPRVPSGASETVLQGVTRLAWPVTLAFLLPFAGLAAYGVPFLLGDRTLVQPARAIGRGGETAQFVNPYLAAFRQQFIRGRIFTADGKLLAVSRPRERKTGRRGDEATGRESRSSTFAPSPRLPVSPSQNWLADLEAAKERQAREYPLGSATAQLVGWTTGGRFAPGVDSVETIYDSELRGYREADLPHLFRARHNPFVRKPAPHDITLTIRAGLQQFLARRLRETVRQWRGAGGAALLFDATTGQVLAAATAPAFDPNNLTLARMQAYVREHSGTQLLTNKALSREALFFPGSTFKLLTAAAALDGPVSGRAVCRSWNGRELTWTYGGVRYRRRVGAIHDYGDRGHGTMSLEEGLGWGLAVSCNVFFATLATRIGPERLSHALHEAGLTVAPEPAKLAPYLAEAGFGQIAVKTAPVEMARLAGALGRAGGDYPGGAEPYWVAKITDDRGQTTVPASLTGSPVTTAYRPFSREVAGRLREMMLRVVNNPSGTAYRAFHGPDGSAWLPDLEIGGKTGTAEFDKLTRTRSGRRVPVRGKHAWFVGFAQERRRFPPRTLAFAVLVEDVRGRATGGTVCAPLAREMLAQVFPPTGAGAPSAARQRDDWFGNLLDRVDKGVQSARRRFFSR